MAHKYVNRAWMTTATTGTGTVTLGSANSGEYYSFAEAGMSSGDTADYVILDGTDVEMGVGTYTSSGTTFSRDTVTSSRISGTAGTSKISLSGSATIFLTSSASEVQAVYDKLLSLAANSVLARADTSAGAVSGVALAASEILGRGSTGNVAAIALGTGLSMSGTTLNAAQGGMQFIGHVSAATTSTQAITGIGSYSSFLFLVAANSTSTSSNDIRVALSSNNGSSYSTTHVIANAYATALKTMNGSVTVSNTNNSGANKVVQPRITTMTDMDATGGADSYSTSSTEITVTGIINAIRFDASHSNVAYSVTVFGIP